MYVKKEGSFLDDIKKMTAMYEQPVNDKPTLLGVQQLEKFRSILSEEVNEIDEIIAQYKEKENNMTYEDRITLLTHLSDWLGDIVVYVSNEAQKHGIPLDSVLEIIMQSNFSKLGINGKPLKDERGKFLKGPNYWKPEPRIKDFLYNYSK